MAQVHMRGVKKSYDNKLEVIFRDTPEPRILVHNRSDLAARMPEIGEVPVPREVKKKKRTKKAEVATPVPARSKAEIEEMKDGATVIVDDNDIDRDTGIGQERQGI